MTDPRTVATYDGAFALASFLHVPRTQTGCSPGAGASSAPAASSGAA
ncbi:hypothetical protein ACFQPA_01670 [Halomarina halobia]|uniref:Uncharacterized protein n=1 Tax=Halomarina halobia TaxID=3033386 RepID=A0ABD6A7T6_9EURY|nr:hypothetical protein [Halomarina sp. PSR21]